MSKNDFSEPETRQLYAYTDPRVSGTIIIDFDFDLADATLISGVTYTSAGHLLHEPQLYPEAQRILSDLLQNGITTVVRVAGHRRRVRLVAVTSNLATVAETVRAVCQARTYNSWTVALPDGPPPASSIH